MTAHVVVRRIYAWSKVLICVAGRLSRRLGLCAGADLISAGISERAIVKVQYSMFRQDILGSIHGFLSNIVKLCMPMPV